MTTDTEIIETDTVDITFQVPSGDTGASALTKARSLAITLSQQLGIEHVTVQVTLPAGDHAEASAPLSPEDMVELQLAIADVVRESDPELAEILSEVSQPTES